MNVQRVLKPNYDEGVDRKTFKVIRERFLKVNDGRLQRTRAALGGRQQVVLDLLPLLFQVNHPLLPGYVSHQTPFGIQGYEPTKDDIAAAQRFSRTFQYKGESRRPADLQSLFLMGSTGTVAHSEGSDMDLWLCHRPSLTADELQALQRKCELICQWAAEMGQEMHIFLINEIQFRQGRHEAAADAEDCGSSQHYLLLDEFYRSSILLAGSCPLWWLIPVYNEADYEHYTHLLEHKRFIRAGEFVNLGGVARIPPEEFIGAGMWQLYKGIDSPYKSVLKLLLTEVYAQEPNALNLSLLFKQAIFEDRLDLDELDPYVLLYRRLETYLKARNELERLELVRRSFYLKVGERLSGNLNRGPKSWRRLVMEKLTGEWGWTPLEIKRLDCRHQWKVQQVQNERRAVVNELTFSYRFLSHYARTQVATAAIRAEDVNLLGRKLYAAFQRKAGKIEFINPGIAPNLAEDQLAFHHKSSQLLSGDANGWMLYRNLPTPADAAFHPVLRRSNSLIELVAWCYFNGIMDASTSISLVAGETQAGLYELQSIIAGFRQALPLPLPAVTQDDYRHHSYPQRCILFVNVALDPMADLTRQGIYRLSNRTDSLGYSSQKSNLVQTLDMVTLNSWHELTVNRFDRGDTIIQCLKNYLAAIAESGPRRQLPQLTVCCFCPTRANAIASRVEELFNDVTGALFLKGKPQSTRYVIELDSRYFVIQFVENEPRFAGFDTVDELLVHLQLPQRQYSPIILDRYAFKDSRLATVCASAQPDKIQVFYFTRDNLFSALRGTDERHEAPSRETVKDKSAEVYILDEHGSLITYTTPFYDQQTLLVPLHRFLRSVQDRRQMHRSLEESTSQSSDIQFYELVDRPGHAAPEVQNRRAPHDHAFTTYLDVQAIGTHERNGRLAFDIFCDHQEFTALEYGDRLIPAVAHYIVSRRAGRTLYPCYITDLGLPHDLDRQQYQAHLQTVQYLRYKIDLEQRLNEAQVGFRNAQESAQS